LNENKDNPADILREPTSGRFATHEHNLPELTLERPYGEDQRRLAELGFVVSHDRALIEGYTVEPNVWVQSAAVPDFPAAQLSEAHHDALLRAEVILDRRRGKPESTDTTWHSWDCFNEPNDGTAVYIRSRVEPWSDSPTTLRVLFDSDGGVVDAREGVAGVSGGALWNEL
jgi:hypothetical protein